MPYPTNMKALLFFTALLALNIGYSQCNISLNTSFVVCDYEDLPLPLETGLTIEGGVAPYTYYWSCSWEPFPGASLHYDEYDILDDPTVSSPNVINSVQGDTLLLTLTVTDAEMNSCEATMNVIQSCFNFTLGAMCDHTSTDAQGNASLGTETSACIEPATYSWSPAESLNDATLPEPVASPSSSTTYTCTITDALGCSDTSQIHVHVSGVNIENETKASIRLYPNPSRDLLKIEMPRAEQWTIRLYNMYGSLVKSHAVNGDQVQINIEDLSSGVYTVVCSDDIETSYRQLVIKE
jgi:hypothetical protein